MAWPSPFFSRPGAVLVSPYDGGVDHHLLIVVVTRQHLEYTRKNTSLGPATVPLVGDLPIPKAPRKIAPGNAGAATVQNRFHKQPVVLRRPTHMTFSAGSLIRSPLDAPQAIATFQPALLKADLP